MDILNRIEELTVDGQMVWYRDENDDFYGFWKGFVIVVESLYETDRHSARHYYRATIKNYVKNIQISSTNFYDGEEYNKAERVYGLCFDGMAETYKKEMKLFMGN